MKNHHWTNQELQRLALAHQGHRPSRAELAAMLPRHTLASITTVGRNIGICRRQSVDWLRRAHEHFARREAGLLQ
jgi:hypothetical protein